MCSVYYNGMYNGSLYTVPTKIVKKDELSDSYLDLELQTFLCSEGDFLCKEIVYKCRNFVVGDVIVIDRDDLIVMDVGLVKAILVSRGSLSVIVRRYKAVMIGQLPLYLCSSDRNDFMHNGLVSVSMGDVIDYYPLMKRGTEDRFVIIMHHHVSFQYK